MYKRIGLVLMVAGCSSDATPGSGVDVDASTGDTQIDAGGTTSGSDSNSSATTDTKTDGTDTATEGSDTSTTTDTSDDGGVSTDVPDADIALDSGLLECKPLSGPVQHYSEAKQALAATHTCGDLVQAAYTGESCGYLVLSYTFGAGDTVTSYYDLETQEMVGQRLVPDAGAGTCTGEVPTGCFSYGGHPSNDAERLCSEGGAPDASPDGSTPDADVPDADVSDEPDADAPDASGQDAPTVDGSVDASSAG